MTQKYCSPYRFNIDIRTCKSRLLVINKEHERLGLEGLNKDQKKCFQCQGVSEALPKPGELICKDCGKKPSEVSRFHPQLELCNSCYQKEYLKINVVSEVNV